uniref:Transposase n=1 Tax=Streptomyces sp. NBC_01393 TaxID=2903851 RepID=A0AAU3I5X7_9ACTN
MPASPFRSYRPAERQEAAQALICQREKALKVLERDWRRERKALRQRLLMTRIQATRASIVSWQDYIAEGCPRVPNATTRV